MGDFFADVFFYGFFGFIIVGGTFYIYINLKANKIEKKEAQKWKLYEKQLKELKEEFNWYTNKYHNLDTTDLNHDDIRERTKNNALLLDTVIYTYNKVNNNIGFEKQMTFESELYKTAEFLVGYIKNIKEEAELGGSIITQDLEDKAEETCRVLLNNLNSSIFKVDKEKFDKMLDSGNMYSLVGELRTTDLFNYNKID